MTNNRAQRRFEKAQRRKRKLRQLEHDLLRPEIPPTDQYEDRLKTEAEIRAHAQSPDYDPGETHGYVDAYGIPWEYDAKKDEFRPSADSDPPSAEDEHAIDYAHIMRQVEAFSARAAKLGDQPDPDELAALKAEDERICALQRAHELRHHAIH
jgi:hypothetical protein